MGILYEISSLTAPVMNQPNISSQSLGSLNQGNQIDVLSFSESWANFKYNNNDAYVNIINLKIVGNEVKGSITLKYIDISTNNEIYCSETLNNLELGNHSYDSKIIYGYKLQNDSIQSVNLTADNPNQVVIFYYKKILGSIIIKYIDITTNTDICESRTIENLTLGTYSYESINISNYVLNDDEIKAVTITEVSPNATITFKYTEILGSITIKYLDASTLTEIYPSTKINNIALDTYNYDAIYIPNYEINGDYSLSTNLTTTDPNKTISFKYTKIDIPKDLNWNEVPYISTYYIKPIVKTGEEVFIDYYITDYYYKEYMEKYNLKEDDWGDDNWTDKIWNNETFTVTIRIDGQNDKLYYYLKAGDHQVSLGKFSTEGEKKFSIFCTDKYGRNSHELFNFFLVQNEVEVKEYIMTDEDLITYNIKNTDDYEIKNIIDLSYLSTKDSNTVKSALIETAANIIPESKTYVCVIADTDGDGNPDNWWAENQVVYATDYDKNAVLEEATNTRIGLQKLLDDKKEEGYSKLTLLPGIYRIDHKSQIYIPNKFTLNMNGATLKQNQFTGNKSLMIELNNTFDSHVINGIIEGDYFSHDYSGDSNNPEWVNGINIGGEAKYSSFDNLIIKDITGYGSSNGIANSRDSKLTYTYLSPQYIGNVFKLGDIDRNTGLDINSTNRTTSDFIDISSYKEINYLSIGLYLGYQGNYCGTWNLICHFYDENKNFIKSIDSYQYRRIGIPINSKYLRITILNESYPSNLSIQHFRIPTHCSFINNEYQNCRCIGMAPCAMKDFLFQNCSFNRCGQSAAKAALDAEDGWDLMQDCTFKSLEFYNNPNSDFLTCAGHNFIIDGQKNGKISCWVRTRSIIIKNCSKVNLSLQDGSNSNIVKQGIYRIFNNTFSKCAVEKNLIKNSICLTASSGKILNSEINGLSNNTNYKNCKIIVDSSFLNYLSSIKMIDCEISPGFELKERYRISFNGGHLLSCYFKNCKFNGLSILDNNNQFYSASFINCTFEDTIIMPSVFANSDDCIYFSNCIINYSNTYLIQYSPFAYNIGEFSTVKFEYCTINNMNSDHSTLIFLYAKANGSCEFNNCTLNSNSELTLLKVSSYTIDSGIKNYILKFNATILPKNILIYDDSCYDLVTSKNIIIELN